MALIGNLRTLAARPCGACGALVDEIEGCEHWGRRETADPEVTISAHRLTRMLGQHQHRVLALAAADRNGVMYSMGDHGLSSAAGKLKRTGLLEVLIPGLGAYRITPAGRAVFDQLESMQHKSEGLK